MLGSRDKLTLQGCWLFYFSLADLVDDAMLLAVFCSYAAASSVQLICMHNNSC